MMKVIVIRGFLDKAAGKERKEGERFSCSPERFREINSTKWGPLVEKVREAKEE